MRLSFPSTPIRFAARNPNIPPDDPAGRQRFFEESRNFILNKDTREKLDNLAKQYNQPAEQLVGRYAALKRLAALEQLRSGQVTPEEEILKKLEEGLKSSQPKP